MAVVVVVVHFPAETRIRQKYTKRSKSYPTNHRTEKKEIKINKRSGIRP